MKTPKPVTTPAKIFSIPAKELELSAVAQSISRKWALHPSWQLEYITAAQFADKVAAFDISISDKNASKATRPQIVRQLALCCKEMDEALTYVKVYLVERYGKASAKSHYPQFGIIHKHKKYILPIDREERSASLQLMVASMNDAYFNDKNYGLAFWTEKHTTFEALRKAAGKKAGEISSKTGINNILKKEIRMVVNSFIHLIKANYPATYKSELRNWGFHKEKY